MMSYRASRNVVRLQLNTNRSASFRGIPLLPSIWRVRTAFNGTSPLECTPSSNAQPQCYRSYATRPASRPKAHTGRTTSSPRVKKPKVTEKAGEIQITAKVTKPKAPTKIKTASKTKATAKVKAKPKAKSKAKPKAKVRAKKPVTEKQKAAAAVKKQSAHVRELKMLALSPPKLKPSTAWLVVTTEMAKESKRLAAKEAAEKYKGLVPEEKEHYNHIANENKAENQRVYREWIHSITPDDVRIANNARHTLRRLGIKGYRSRLVDDRQVARPTMAHIQFCKDRFSTGDMKGIAAVDAMKQIMKEWKELGEADKQNYYNLQAQSLAQYNEGVKTVYHRDIDLSATTTSPAATATVA